MCVCVCVWNLKDREKKKIDVTALHLLQNMPDSLWWDRLTPNASPPHPPHSHHTLPAPTTFILAHVTSVLGTAEQVFSLPWQPVERARPLAASGEEKKRPAVSEVARLVPACHCFQSAAGGATLPERAAAGRGPQGPPATAVDPAGRKGGPRGQCH